MKLAALVLLAAALPTYGQSTQPAEVASVECRNGFLRWNAIPGETCGSQWSLERRPDAWQLSAGTDAGRTNITVEGTRWHVSWSAFAAKGDKPVRLSVEQWGTGEVTAEFVIRVSNPEPDPVYRRTHANLATLYDVTPHVGKMLDDALRIVWPEWKYDGGAVVHAQRDPLWTPDESTVERARRMLERMADPDWREREKATAEAAADPAVACVLALRLPVGLTEEQRRCAAVAVSYYARIER